ncbi:fasciclin domain-containing protein [Roseovarius sp.]|uniref:fasciclin domain-containing protein n=1 Tax=Roseovarius sp. TaxID=1486281 RepID=UPI00356463B9
MIHKFTRREALRLGAGFAALTGLSACAVPGTSTPDIVDTAVATGSFTTLVAAVQAAGLVDTLKSPGPFTVFAPTDDAFAALPAGTVESLLLPQNKPQLVEILTYHVVAGRVLAAQLQGTRSSVTTVEGRALHIDGRKGVRINNANVITPDVMASNGIIHVIDGVLLPS